MDELIKRHKPSQNVKELTTLLEEVEAIDPLVILEIGCDQGNSLKVWSEAFDPAMIIGINDLPIKGLEIPELLLIEADSHNHSVLNQIKKRLVDDEIDFLFIDGDHSYGGVKQDWKMYSPLVREGGIIALHDIKVDPNLYPGGEMGVKYFWSGLIKSLPEDWDYKEVWDEEGKGTGTGIIYVGEK